MSAREHTRLGRQQELTRSGHQQAKHFLNLAIEEDSEYLPAFVELSYALVRESQNDWGEDRGQSLAQARQLADIAVALSDNAGITWFNDFRGRWYSAIVSWNEGDFSRSFQEFDDARARITPERFTRDSSDLDADMAEALIYFGQPQQAVEMIRDAMDRNPEFHYWYRWNLGRALYMTGHFQEAIDTIAMIEAPPNDVRLIVAASLAQLGQTADAQAVMAEFSARDPDWTVQKSAEYRYGSDSDRQHWINGLRMAGLRET
jgi:tetratricopeptide (TPR) repeat protein